MMAERKAPSRIVVITGGIGAGKSTILKRFTALGAHCVDADEVAHSLYEPESAVTAAIAAHFGAAVIGSDGRPDRKALAAKVFNNPSELAWLNGVTHPAIRQRIDEAAAAVAPEPLFAAIPLWYESGWSIPGVTVVATWCSAPVQMERLRQRGWSDEESRRRIASQISMDEKFARADYGIITECSWERLAQQCAEILRRIRAGSPRNHA